MNRAYNTSKHITQKPLIPNIIEASAQSIPPNLLSQFSYPTNHNQSNSSKNSKSPISFNPKDFICNTNEDTPTMIQKNKRLIQLVVQSSSKIAEMNESRKRIEEQHNQEKQEWLAKLDRITNNYKTYAESYQNFTIMKEEFDNLQRDFRQGSQVLKHYESLLKQTLNDLIASYKNINFYLVSEKLNNSIELSIDYYMRSREELKDKLISYNEKIDRFSFEEISQEIEILKGNFKKETTKNKLPLSSKSEVELKSSPVRDKAIGSPIKKKDIFTKKETYKQTKHIRQRSCDSKQNRNNLNDMESKNKRINESYNEINNICNEVNNKIEKMFTTQQHQNHLSKQNVCEEMNKEMNENSEYTPQFIYSDEKQKITGTALYDFIPQRKTELGFKKGDIIEIEIIKDNGWWQGCLNGERGLIPYNYIRINE